MLIFVTAPHSSRFLVGVGRRGLRNELLRNELHAAISAHQDGTDRTFGKAAVLDREITTLARQVSRATGSPPTPTSPREPSAIDWMARCAPACSVASGASRS
jgi:hypothetical protein